MADPDTDPNADKDPDARLDALESRIRNMRAASPENRGSGPGDGAAQGRGLGLALRASVDIVSALAVGTGVGWLLDEWLGTRPWLMLVFIILGGCAGMLNVYRVAKGYGYAAGYHPPDKK
ncbi:MAG: AtpZ/AtpI family protein [Rhodospirillales bacterium]